MLLKEKKKNNKKPSFFSSTSIDFFTCFRPSLLKFYKQSTQGLQRNCTQDNICIYNFNGNIQFSRARKLFPNVFSLLFMNYVNRREDFAAEIAFVCVLCNTYFYSILSIVFKLHKLLPRKTANN